MAAILKGTTVVRSGDGADVYLRALLGGELAVADFFAIKALKGQMFNVSGGTVTTPITWGATATIDITKPILWVSIPSNKAIIPVSLSVYYEAFGTSAQMEVNAVAGTGGSRTSGGTAVTPTCTRTDVNLSSGCTAYVGDSTPVFVGSTANLVEFWHDGQQFTITKTAGSATASAADPYRFVWRALDEHAFVICGPSSQLAIHQGSQAGTGFVKLVYVEVPSADLP